MIERQRLLEAVEAQGKTIRDVMAFVHGHPELGHEEVECSRYLCETFENAGFSVERPLAGMETAFRATATGAGQSVGFVCLYDAVAAVRPDGRTEAVHSCGHGPIAGGVTGAALALASFGDELPGTVTVVGCPADEIHAPGTIVRGGGKALTAEAGVWDGIDAAMYAHPEFIDTVSLQSRWLRRATGVVSGSRMLASADQAPYAAAAAALEEAGKHVPDNVMLERLELDGDVEEATGLFAKATFLLFGDEEQEVEAGLTAVRAALPDATWEIGRLYEAVRLDERVTAAVAGAFRALGRDFVDDPPRLPFATDFGNISRRCPAALIGVGRPGGWKFHTDEGAAEFASAEGEAAATTVAQVLALAALEILDPAG